MNFAFRKGYPKCFLTELQAFQNSDGGFGHGLEPDFRTPFSSNVATTYAFQYFQKLNQQYFPDFLVKGLEYFVNRYLQKIQGWIPIPQETDESPHAIWWNYDYEKYLKDSEWGNPTVEVIGYLLQYPNTFDATELEKLKQKALLRLFESETIEIHELMCYQRFVKLLDDNAKKAVYDRISLLANRQVERDVNKWGGYVPRPLNFVDSPISPVYDVLKQDVENELDYLIDTLEQGCCWNPNWEWRQYEEEWQKVKPLISGMVTVKNLLTLKTFGRIES